MVSRADFSHLLFLSSRHRYSQPMYDWWPAGALQKALIHSLISDGSTLHMRLNDLLCFSPMLLYCL
jgi:hypothetical protein